MSAQPVVPTERSLEEVAGAVDAALERARTLDAHGQDVLADVRTSLDELHRRALVTVVRRLRDDPRGKELLFELVDDPLVHMVLSLHGIVRPDPAVTARRVLDTVRPGLQSHGGDVEFDHIADGVAFVRLQGACNGCSMAAVTMRNGVEAALVEGVPGIRAVEVLPNDPSPTLIPLSSLTRRPADREDRSAELLATGWCRADGARDLAVGELRAVTLTGAGAPVEAIVVNAAGSLAAYVNECAHQGLPLDDALVDADEGTITCPWHGFCYDATNGECMSMPGAQLEQLPLRIEDGAVWIRLVDDGYGGG